MNLKAIANVVTSKVGRQILIGRKHSPTILFAAGVVGVVGTVVLASRATLKLEDVLGKAEEDLQKREIARTVEGYSDQDYMQDGVLIYMRTAGQIVKLYAPAAIVGLASIAALTGSHVTLTRRNVAVMAAYSALDKGFREYRARVTKEFGVEKDRELLWDMEDREYVEDTKTGPVVKTLKQPGANPSAPYGRFFDEFSSNWSKIPGQNQIFLAAQQNWANDLLRSRGHVFLNEVYDMLGISRTKEGQLVGWIYDCCEDPVGDNYIDFGVFEGNRQSGMRFVLGHEKSVYLDFNVDGIIYDKI